MRQIAVGDRIVVTAYGDPRYGESGTVTRAQYPSLLTGRPMVDVLFDGDRVGIDDEGAYLEQIELEELAA